MGCSPNGYVGDPLAWIDPLGLAACGPGGFKHGVTEEEIDAINKSLGGTNAMNSSISSALAAAERREGFWNKAAAIVRDIAGGHMFNDANKRTAQTVVELLMERNKIATGVTSEEMKRVINSVAGRKIREVDAIKRALRGS